MKFVIVNPFNFFRDTILKFLLSRLYEFLLFILIYLSLTCDALFATRVTFYNLWVNRTLETREYVVGNSDYTSRELLVIFSYIIIGLLWAYRSTNLVYVCYTCVSHQYKICILLNFSSNFKSRITYL